LNAARSMVFRSCTKFDKVSVFGPREESIVIAFVEVVMQKEKRMEVDDAFMDYI